MGKVFSSGVVLLLVVVVLMFISKNNYQSTLGEQTSNLLANPGFENDASSWHGITSGIESLDSSTTHSGNKSLEFFLDKFKEAGVNQYISVNANTSYRLGVWIKTQDVGEKGVAATVMWLSKNGEDFGWSDIIDPFNYKMVGKVSGTNDWKYYEGSFTSPTNAKVAVVGPSLNGGSGKAWFDDLSFSPVNGSELKEERESTPTLTPTEVKEKESPKPSVVVEKKEEKVTEEKSPVIEENNLDKNGSQTAEKAPIVDRLEVPKVAETNSINSIVDTIVGLLNRLLNIK